jgi:hypothetical protein
LSIGLYYNTEATESETALFFLMFTILGTNSYFLANWAFIFLDSNLGKIVRKVKKLDRLYNNYLDKKISEAQSEIEQYIEKHGGKPEKVILNESSKLKASFDDTGKPIFAHNVSQDASEKSDSDNEEESFDLDATGKSLKHAQLNSPKDNTELLNEPLDDDEMFLQVKHDE